MTKTAYRKPLAELVKFDDSDIICASNLGWDQDEADKFKDENPDAQWGCMDIASKLAE